MKNLILVVVLFLTSYLSAQVKIGNNPGTINSNSLLELESTNKGFLPPRVALNDQTLVAPLSGTVPAGMIVFSSGGTLPDGFYYWTGAEWKMLASAKLNVVSKTANATLNKAVSYTHLDVYKRQVLSNICKNRS